MAFAKTLKDQKLNIFCDYCFKNTTLETYYRCEDCRFDACEICFFAELETNNHKKLHRFRVVSNLESYAELGDWRIIDELLLLDGLLSYGFGNFEDISKILPGKSENEVKRHFYELMGIADNEEDEKYFETVPKSNPNDSFIASFMPKRREFDSEILNEYEGLIEELASDEDDKELEKELKRYLFNNYRVVLHRRKIWRNFIFDRNLLDVKHPLAREKTDVGDIGGKYKWLSQFISKRDFNVFIAGLVREKQMRDALAKHPEFFVLQNENLINNSMNLSENEFKLCNQLRLATGIYTKIKKMAIERYLGRLPLKAPLLDLFQRDEYPRAMILYKWFLDHRIVIEDQVELE